MREKIFICAYFSNFILGGIESYYIRMFRWAKEHNYKNMLLLPKGKSVADAWELDIQESKIQKGFYNNRYLTFSIKDEKDKKIIFNQNSEVMAIAADLFSYIKLQQIKHKYQIKNMKIIFYVFLPEFCRASKKKIINLPYYSVIKKLFDSGMTFMDEETLNFCENFYKCKLDHEKIVRLGLEINAISEKNIIQRVNSRKEEFNILTITRLDFPFKSYVLGLIDTYKKLKKNYPTVKLLIIGDGNGRVQLQKKIDNIEADQRKDIILLGSVPYNNLKEYFEKAHLYIGMGTTLLDAGTTGLPGIIAKAHNENALTTGFFYEEYNNLSGNEKINDKELKNCQDYIEKIINFSDEEYRCASLESYNIVFQYYEITRSMDRLINFKDNVKIGSGKILFLSYYGWLLRKVQELGWG